MPKRPLLLGVFAAVLTLQAVFLPVLGVVTLLSASDSIVVYNGVEVPMSEVRLKLFGMLLLWFALAVYVGPGLWRGRAMAREVLFGICLVAAVAGLVMTFVTFQGRSGLVVATGYVGVSSLIGCCIVRWYLYMKPNVREFFERRSNLVANAVSADGRR